MLNYATETFVPVLAFEPPNAAALWIALDAALGGINEWQDRHSRCTFAARDGGSSITVEAVQESYVLTLDRPATAPARFSILFDGELGATVVHSDGHAASDESVRTLTDMLWGVHRLAKEDAITMVRA